MKICFLAPASNYHTKKWCRWFSENGHEVHVVSFVRDEIKNVDVHFVDAGVSVNSGDLKKVGYLLNANKVRKIVEDIAPDIINVHYATSYGTVAALAGLNNYVLSVWGMDIYDFPKKSIFHRIMLKFSLDKAGYIFSTSNAMAQETKKYTKKKIEITPFGVDMELFNPKKRLRSYHGKTSDEFIIGTVKSLTPKYGIDYLIKAVAIVRRDNPDISIKLRIAGSGENEKEYKTLARKEGIEDITTWLGFISQEKAAYEWANMDVAVIASTLDSESFGVSAVEAEASSTPVIISDIPGLMEATCPGVTSIVVSRKNEYELANAIMELLNDKNKYNELKKNCRAYVENRYSMQICFNNIEKFFREVIEMH